MAALLLQRGSKCCDKRVWSLYSRFSCFQTYKKLLESSVTSYLPLVTPNKRGLKSGHVQVGYSNIDQALCKLCMLRIYAIL